MTSNDFKHLAKNIMNFLEIEGKKHSPSQKQIIDWRENMLLTGNGLISLIREVILEDNNTNNLTEKWLKNMKYKWLLNMYMFIINTDFPILNDYMSGKRNQHKNKSDKTTDLLDFI